MSRLIFKPEPFPETFNLSIPGAALHLPNVHICSTYTYMPRKPRGVIQILQRVVARGGMKMLCPSSSTSGKFSASAGRPATFIGQRLRSRKQFCRVHLELHKLKLTPQDVGHEKIRCEPQSACLLSQDWPQRRGAG